MSSAEVTLQIKTQVGNVSPTMLQTLLILLNLYLKPDTDRDNLIQTIESDTTVFKAYLQAASPATLSGWHEAISTEQLRELSLALANQAATGPLGINSDGSLDRDALVATSRSLMSALDPDQVRGETGGIKTVPGASLFSVSPGNPARYTSCHPCAGCGA